MFKPFNQLRHYNHEVKRYPANTMARDQYAEGTSSKAQGKKPMAEGLHLRDEDSDYEIEEQPVQTTKASGKKKASGKQKAPELTPADYYGLFKKQDFEGTRYPDIETMRELGIADDVEYLFQQCHLGKMMHTPYAGYQEETIQFLSSLELHILHKGMGVITFSVFDHDYSMPMSSVEALFGFPSGSGTKQSYNKEELNSLWAIIGNEKTFSSSRAKSNHIRSPVLRYFHRSLANVFFARSKSGTIVNGEMEFMIMALKDLLLQMADGPTLVGDSTNTSLSYILVHQLLSYKSWVLMLESKGTTGSLCVGGLVTLFLEAQGVPLRSAPTDYQRIDPPYLQATQVLKKGLVGGKLAYNFTRPTSEISQVLLPCEQLTSFSEPGSVSNIAFDPPTECLHMTRARTAGSSAAVPDTDIADDPMETGEDQIEYSGEGYAPERYYFDEYSNTVRQGKAVIAAHDRANTLQRWNKAQDELLRAQGRELKANKKEIKSLRSRLKNFIKKFSCSSSATVLHTTSTSPVRQAAHDPEEQVDFEQENQPAYVEEEQADYMQEDQPVYQQPEYYPEEQADDETEIQAPFVAPARHSSYQHSEREYVPVPARSSAHEPRERKRRSVKKKHRRQGSTRRDREGPSSEHPPHNI